MMAGGIIAYLGELFRGALKQNHAISYFLGGLLPRPPPDGLPVWLGPFGGLPPALNTML